MFTLKLYSVKNPWRRLIDHFGKPIKVLLCHTAIPRGRYQPVRTSRAA
jgi:hypothetical protein